LDCLLPLTPPWKKDPVVLVPATLAIRLCSQGDHQPLAGATGLWHIDRIGHTAMAALRGFVRQARLSSTRLTLLDDREVLAMVRDAVVRRDLVVLQVCAERTTEATDSTTACRRLIRRIVALAGPKLAHGGRQYALVADLDFAKLANQGGNVVVRHDEAVAVLDGLARSPGRGGAELATLLGEARSKLTRDWRPPLTPDGIVMVHLAAVAKAATRPDAPAITPSQMRELVKKQWTLTNPRWEHKHKQRRADTPNAVLYGDDIFLRADVQGAPDGTMVRFDIMDETADPPELLDTLSGPNQGGTAEVLWSTRDLAASHVPGAELSASFTANLEEERTKDCPIPYLPERGRLHVVVRSLHLERPFGEHAIDIAGHGVKAHGTLNKEGLYEYPDEVPFGQYDLTVGEFETTILAVRDGDPPFVVPAPPEAIPDSRWRPEDHTLPADDPYA
jgi:hypothetical protein